MALLYYWRGDNYRRDLDMGVAYHLNQASRSLHDIGIGDSLWAFTQTRTGSYSLAAELIIQAKTQNRPGYRYGRYRVWGNVRTSRYFDVWRQSTIEPLVRGLSCPTRAKHLGQSFQGHSAVRRLTPQDHALLVDWARDIPLEPRACLLPEERLEQALYGLSEERLATVLAAGYMVVSEQRREYLYSTAPSRNRNLVTQLQDLYEGRCQLCRWDPRDRYGTQLSQGHHIRYLSRGGDDVLENMMLLCPNHHTAIHQCDAQLGYGAQDLAFAFSSHRERVELDLHLRVQGNDPFADLEGI